MASVDAIIVNYNSGKYLADCVKSIKDGVSNVIVVDNASTDDSLENIFNCNIIMNKENKGFAGGVNAGIKASKSDYFLILNPDTRISPANIKILTDFLDNNINTAIVGPKIFDEHDKLTPNGRVFPSITREILFNTKLYKLNKRSFNLKYEWGRSDFNKSTEVDEVIGACFQVSRKAIDEVGLMDEQFFLYYEETDWCMRFKNAGWKVWYLADAEAKHIGGHSTKNLEIEKYRIAFKSQYLYFKKHHSLFEAIVIRLLGRFILLLMGFRYH